MYSIFMYNWWHYEKPILAKQAYLQDFVLIIRALLTILER